MLQAALSVLSEGVVSSVAELTQSQVHQNAQINEAQKAYRLSIFALTLDILSKCRDEVKDLFESYSNRIDNYFVVHTLLLSIGFAALQYSDSMMPKRDSPAAMLFLFTTLFALSMVVPLFAIVSLLRVRLHLNHWYDDLMSELNKETSIGFHHVETSRRDSYEVIQMDLVKELGSLLSRCSQSCETMWSEKCKIWYDAAGYLFWVCLLMNLMLVGLMMGYYFEEKYSDDGWISYYFGTILIFGACSSSVFLRPMGKHARQPLETPLLRREHDRINRLDID